MSPQTQTVTPQGQASGSSFYAAMRLMPPDQRAAMFAIYAFCRKVDDIADDPGPTRAQRRESLNAWRSDLAHLYAGLEGIGASLNGDSRSIRRNAGGEVSEKPPKLAPTDAPPARVAELVEPIQQFHLAQEDFLAVIDGMEMDVDEDIRAPAFDKLDLYCDRVASAVGRLSVNIFGMPDGPGRALAHHLGRALQFTNILRDLDEDAAIGRLYLPAEALTEGGIETDDIEAIMAHPGLDTACRWLARRAHDHYAAADRVLEARPAGRLRTPRLMSSVYNHILRRMEADGWAAPRTRVRIRKRRLLWIVLTRGLAD